MKIVDVIAKENLNLGTGVLVKLAKKQASLRSPVLIEAGIEDVYFTVGNIWILKGESFGLESNFYTESKLVLGTKCTVDTSKNDLPVDGHGDESESVPDSESTVDTTDDDVSPEGPKANGSGATVKRRGRRGRAKSAPNANDTAKNQPGDGN